jgi:ubiquinone biosynthesis protein COQ9
MTVPNKTPRKKAALKTQTSTAESKTPPRDDQGMREAVLAAMLPHAAFDGFTDSVLQKAGTQAGVAKADLARVFENGILSLVEFYSMHTDSQM